MATALQRISRRAQSLFSQNPAIRHHKIHTGVWWDYDHCLIPDGCEKSIGPNIRNALANLNYDGPVSIAAYHEFHLPLDVHQALTDTGVSPIHVESCFEKGISARMLLDMYFWAIAHPPPANCLLISNDGGMSYGLHDLGKHYNILLARHGNVRPHLESAAKTVWRWTSLRAGGPPQKTTADTSMVSC